MMTNSTRVMLAILLLLVQTNACSSSGDGVQDTLQAESSDAHANGSQGEGASGDVGDPPFCCTQDSECPSEFFCIVAADGTGQCRPEPHGLQCYHETDCPPYFVCGDVPKFGCDSTGVTKSQTCSPALSGCCGGDTECPDGAVCVQTGEGEGVCLPAPFSQLYCWDDDDCAPSDMCQATITCACGDSQADCHPSFGKCIPTPFSKCMKQQTSAACYYVGELLYVPQSAGELVHDFDVEHEAAVGSATCSDCNNTNVWKVKNDGQWTEVTVDEFCAFLAGYSEPLGWVNWPGDC